MRYSRTTFEAEDILQDSYIKIFQNIDSYNLEFSFEGWIKKIVQNTAINNYRKNIKFNSHISLENDDGVLENNELADVFEQFNTNELLKLINELPEGYRLAINMFCIDGYSHQEIAEMLGISIGTSKSQVHKAKQFLKNIIATKLEIQVR